MTEQEQAAAADPRVGDEWILPAAISPLTCNVVCVGDNVQVLYCGEPKYMTKSRFAYWLRKAGWTLAARGPAPAKPSRDPATTPVVGDEWDQDNGHLNLSFKVDSIDDDNCYFTFGDGKQGQWERNDWATFTKHRKIHRRGDDPAWRPEPAKTPPLPHDGKCDYDYAEQTAAGIKVGDRVRNCVDNEGVVDEIAIDRVWADFNGERRWMGLDDWHTYWTIIPPADAPERDDAGDRNPHTEPMVGDEWEDDDEDTLQVIYAGDDSVVMWNDDYKYASQWSRKEFAEESFAWRLSKAADMDPDDTGDEPPTPAFEGDPSAERFATYQPDPVEDQHYRDDKYIRRIFSRSGNDSIDVDIYNVLDAYKTGCPAIDHATKKLLCAGIRGSKSRMQDLREARDSIMRAMEMQHQREAVAAAKGKQ